MQRDPLREHAGDLLKCYDIHKEHSHTHVRARVTDAAPSECIDHVMVRLRGLEKPSKSRITHSEINGKNE